MTHFDKSKVKNRQSKIIIFIGRSGSGKGTHAKMLEEKLGFEYLGMGDLLRARKAAGGFSGKKIGETMDGGKFAPSAVVVQVAMNELDEKKKEENFNGLVIDGVTRILPEAEMLDEGLEWFEWDKEVYVISIDISEQEAVSRLLNRRACADCRKIIPYIGELKHVKQCHVCGGELVTRADDSSEGVKGRMAEYNKYVVPVIEYYEKAGRLIHINGEQSIEAVHKDIMKAIGV